MTSRGLIVSALLTAVGATMSAGCAAEDEDTRSAGSAIEYRNSEAFGCELYATQQDITTPEFNLPNRFETSSRPFRTSYNPELPGPGTHIKFRIYDALPTGWDDKAPPNAPFVLSDKLDLPNRDLFTPPPKGYWNITAEYGSYNVVDSLLTFTKRSEQMVDGMKIISLSGFGPRAGADNLLPMLSIELDQAQTTAALLAMGATGFVSKKLPALGLLSTQVNRSKGNGHVLRVQRHLPPEDNNGISFHVSFQCFFK